MRILISADMEGISGVVSNDQVDRTGRDYQATREIMTGEVNNAIEGALLGGAQEIIVNDSHDSMRNIIISKLHPKAKLISGWLKELSMLQGLQEGVDGIFCLGYHAKKGTANAILDHTYSYESIWRVSINDVEMGETGINAFLAGAFNIPILLVSGDDKVCKEAEELLDNVITAPVKKAYSRYAALCLNPQEAGALIKDKAKLAVENSKNIKPYQLTAPYSLELEFTKSPLVESALLIPEVERKNSTTVTYTNNDAIKVFKVFLSMVSLG